MYSFVFYFSSRRRHTRCALVTGVQTCALPILVDAWPLVRAARASAEEAAAYLQRFHHGTMPANAMVAPPGVDGRIFYDESVRGFHFHRERVPLAVALKRSEERRVGKECVSTCRSRWSADH